jgi:pantoate--beta-alanine ligase
MARNVRTAHTVGEVRDSVRAWRADGERIAFVPTMGNLHAGHVSLAAQAAQAADRVVVSIFVNPTQFGIGEDFAAYPRTLDDDRALVSAADVGDLLFVPGVSEIYPFGLEQAIGIRLPALAEELCGASRPGHFDGVASVVCRLLHIVAPDLVLLGQKDYQQFILMRRMVDDLSIPVELRMGPTLREPDGLAMSSRNRYLDAEQRSRAPLLHAALARVRDALRDGSADHERLTTTARTELATAGFRPDYVEIRSAADLSRPSGAASAEQLVVLGAAWLGRARLIDNLLV